MATNKKLNIDGSFLEKFPDCVNILILGKTGVGKSTFINGLVNYLKYGSIDEARKGNVDILIKTHFTCTDDSGIRWNIDCDPTIVVERGEKDNEDTEAGSSATQSPKSYLFSWGPEKPKKYIRIIDTPGVGDVRGLDMERENFTKILNFIADFEEVHAIFILLTPDEPRLDLTFRYCINELLAHLHKSASENIVFCFTKSRQTRFRPGDSLPTLEMHLKNLVETKGIKIPLNQDTMYCFDNEAFRYLCAQHQGMSFKAVDVRGYKDSWEKTTGEILRLFKRISELPPHCVTQTLSVNNIRAVILALSRPLAEITRLQLMNMKLVEDKLSEVDEYVKTEKNLEGRLYVDQLKHVTKAIDYPITVCTAKDCVEYIRLSNDPAAPTETVYKTECHEQCQFVGVQVEVCPNVKLQGCWAIHQNVNKCRVCSCPWSTHMHIRYKLEKVMEKVVDPTVQKMINEKRDQTKTAQTFIASAIQHKAELFRDHEKISKYCVHFAAFVRKNSLLPYNDAYMEYIEHLIREEKDKVFMGGSDALLKQLEIYKNEYEEQVKILKKEGETTDSTKSLEEIYGMVEELKKMKSSGSVLADVQKLELISVRQQQMTQAASIDLNSGWWGKWAANFFGAAINAVKNTVMVPFNAMKDIVTGSRKRKINDN